MIAASDHVVAGIAAVMRSRDDVGSCFGMLCGAWPVFLSERQVKETLGRSRHSAQLHMGIEDSVGREGIEAVRKKGKDPRKRHTFLSLPSRRCQTLSASFMNHSLFRHMIQPSGHIAWLNTYMELIH
jgi:hypothetical protein